MYLSYGIQLDILFVVGQFSKQNADPRVEYLKAAKKVVQYLKDTIHLRLTYVAHPKPDKEKKAKAKVPDSQLTFGLIGYADSNYAGNPKIGSQ